MSKTGWLMIAAALLSCAVAALWNDLQNEQATVARLVKERDRLSTQLRQQQSQNLLEQIISQGGLANSQQGNAEQEKTRIEIREKIIHEPCADQPVPDDVAVRMWQLVGRARNNALPTAASQPDSRPATTITE
jgi:hypothetical protein